MVNSAVSPRTYAVQSSAEIGSDGKVHVFEIIKNPTPDDLKRYGSRRAGDTCVRRTYLPGQEILFRSVSRERI